MRRCTTDRVCGAWYSSKGVRCIASGAIIRRPFRVVHNSPSISRNVWAAGGASGSAKRTIFPLVSTALNDRFVLPVSGALTRVSPVLCCGRVVSVDEVMRDLAEDIPFYGESGGGVTVSGGEPGCQSDFTAEILHRCHKMKIHAALETNLAYSRAILEKLVAGCDLVMADLKHIDSQKHRAGTGHGNEQVLENLRSLTVPLILRTPIVPGFNDDAGTIRRIAEFAVKLDTLQYYELLTYHPLGCGKAERLGMEKRAKPQASPTICRSNCPPRRKKKRTDAGEVPSVREG